MLLEPHSSLTPTFAGKSKMVSPYFYWGTSKCPFIWVYFVKGCIGKIIYQLGDQLWLFGAIAMFKIDFL